MECTLQVRGDIHNCEIKERPSHVIKEVINSGIMKLEHKWNPLKIKFKDRTFFGLYGKFDAEMQIEEDNTVETWKFSNAEYDGKAIIFDNVTSSIKKKG